MDDENVKNVMEKIDRRRRVDVFFVTFWGVVAFIMMFFALGTLFSELDREQPINLYKFFFNNHNYLIPFYVLTPISIIIFLIFDFTKDKINYNYSTMVPYEEKYKFVINPIFYSDFYRRVFYKIYMVIRIIFFYLIVTCFVFLSSCPKEIFFKGILHTCLVFLPSFLFFVIIKIINNKFVRDTGLLQFDTVPKKKKANIGVDILLLIIIVALLMLVIFLFYNTILLLLLSGFILLNLIVLSIRCFIK